MVLVCCVEGCYVTDHDIQGQTFHRLPENLQLRELWLRSIGQPKNDPTDLVICSRHFEKKWVKHDTGLVRTATTVPTLFVPRNSELMSMKNVSETVKTKSQTKLEKNNCIDGVIEKSINLAEDNCKINYTSNQLPTKKHVSNTPNEFKIKRLQDKNGQTNQHSMQSTISQDIKSTRNQFENTSRTKLAFKKIHNSGENCNQNKRDVVDYEDLISPVIEIDKEKKTCCKETVTHDKEKKEEIPIIRKRSSTQISNQAQNGTIDIINLENDTKRQKYPVNYTNMNTTLPVVKADKQIQVTEQTKSQDNTKFNTITLQTIQVMNNMKSVNEIKTQDANKQQISRTNYINLDTPLPKTINPVKHNNTIQVACSSHNTFHIKPQMFYEKQTQTDYDSGQTIYYDSRIKDIKITKLLEIKRKQSRRIKLLLARLSRRNKRIARLSNIIKKAGIDNNSVPKSLKKTAVSTVSSTTSDTVAASNDSACVNNIVLDNTPSDDEPRLIVHSVQTINNKLGILIESVTPADSKLHKNTQHMYNKSSIVNRPNVNKDRDIKNNSGENAEPDADNRHDTDKQLETDLSTHKAVINSPTVLVTRTQIDNSTKIDNVSGITKIVRKPIVVKLPKAVAQRVKNIHKMSQLGNITETKNLPQIEIVPDIDYVAKNPGIKIKLASVNTVRRTTSHNNNKMTLTQSKTHTDSHNPKLANNSKLVVKNLLKFNVKPKIKLGNIIKTPEPEAILPDLVSNLDAYIDKPKPDIPKLYIQSTNVEPETILPDFDNEIEIDNAPEVPHNSDTNKPKIFISNKSQMPNLVVNSSNKFRTPNFVSSHSNNIDNQVSNSSKSLRNKYETRTKGQVFTIRSVKANTDS